MKRKSNIRMGPGAASLILIFVVLAMSILAMLTFMNSRNDAGLSARSIEVAEAVYGLNEKAELTLARIAACRKETAEDAAFLAAVNAGGSPDIGMEDGEIFWTETDGTRTLDCAVRPVAQDGRETYVWVRHLLETGTEEEWDW